MSDEAPAPAVPGSASVHKTPAETREITYDRARRGGLGRDAARRAADEVARRLHDNPDRRGR